MTTRRVSMSEINRVAPWSLRALGHPFAVAERATRLLTWTQAAVGHALEMLRVGEQALAASTRAPAAYREGDATTGRRIDARGRNLLELGAPALDLATCDARLTGAGHVIVARAIGTLIVPALADLAVKRGLAAVVAFRAGADEITLDGWPPEGWVAARPDTGAPRFFLGDLDTLPAVAEGLGGALSPLLRRHAAVLASREAVVTIALAPPAGSAWTLPGAVDFPERIACAYRDGIEVPTHDLNHLYALERITWAPTSERSRKQAGY